MSGTLIDTNILIYAFSADMADPRSAAAKSVMNHAASTGSYCVSLQVLSEFSAFFLNKAAPRLAPARVKQALGHIRALCRVLSADSGTVDLALDAVERHSMSFWDALIWGVAKENGVEVILSEDMQDGQVIEGVRIRNPLRGAP
jgi:predicted nucleic acid-binding protein